MDSNQYVSIDKTEREPRPGLCCTSPSTLQHPRELGTVTGPILTEGTLRLGTGTLRLGTDRWLSRSHRQTFLQVDEPGHEPDRLVPAESWPQAQGSCGWGEGWKTEQQRLLGRGGGGVGLESRAANPEGRLARADATLDTWHRLHHLTTTSAL